MVHVHNFLKWHLTENSEKDTIQIADIYACEVTSNREQFISLMLVIYVNF